MPRMSTILWWLFVGFIIWFVISNPAGAASVWHGIAGFFSNAAHSVSTFLVNISPGH